MEVISLDCRGSESAGEARAAQISHSQAARVISPLPVFPNLIFAIPLFFFPHRHPPRSRTAVESLAPSTPRRRALPSRARRILSTFRSSLGVLDSAAASAALRPDFAAAAATATRDPNSSGQHPRHDATLGLCGAAPCQRRLSPLNQLLKICGCWAHNRLVLPSATSQAH